MTEQERFEASAKMFEKSVMPKLVIDKIGSIEKIIVAMDDTPKSKTCMELGKRLSKHLKTRTKFLKVHRYGAHLLDYIRTTELAAERTIEDMQTILGDDPGFKAELGHLAGVPPRKALEIIEKALEESGGAIGMLIDEIENFQPDLVITPVPFAEEAEFGADVGEDSLGTALDLILRRTSRRIPILLVEGEKVIFPTKNILCAFHVEQTVEAIRITLTHACKMADTGAKITLLGIIDPRLVETFADVYGEVQKEEPDIPKVKDALRSHMEDLLEGVQVKLDKKISIRREIAFGQTDDVLKQQIVKDSPGLVIYRSEFLPHDPLDNMADQIARHENNIPVLIVWE